MFITPVSKAEEKNLPVLKTETKRVAIFKNGLGFFMREGKTNLRNGWAVIDYVPNATLGTVWIAALDKGANLEEVIAFREEVDQDKEVISLVELLKANIGKKVIVTSRGKTIEGTVVSVPEDRELNIKRSMHSRYSGHRPPTSRPEVATLAVIRTKEGAIALNKNSISQIEFIDDCSTKLFGKEEVKRIRFKVATRKKNATLSMSYLEKGISWVPSYLINIADPQKARITMKATVINDIEDIENVDLSFVVGYPNFVYADVLSPLSLEYSLAQLIAALQQGGGRREYSRLANIMRQSVSFARDESIPALDFGYAAIKGLPGASEEDLFLYDKKSVTLKKGERAYYHIFSDMVDYKHIYEWQV